MGVYAKNTRYIVFHGRKKRAKQVFYAEFSVEIEVVSAVYGYVIEVRT